MMNNEEKELKKLFKRETDKAVDVKDKTWNKIESELFPKQKKTSWKSKVAVGLGTVVAALILIIISTNILTNDQAGEQEKPEEQNEPNEQEPSNEVDVPLEDQYDKEIQREREPEGQLEVIDMELAVNEEDRYIVYVDKERDEFVIENGEGHIQSIEKLDEIYPEVGITIKQHTHTTMDDLIAGVKEKTTKEDMTVIEEKAVTYPFDAHAITAYASVDTYEWDSPVHRYYVYEADKGVYFVFKQMFFMEAWEENNNIFDFMLDTFEYVPRK